ncbi:tetratricopeptide repeat protein [Streptomyces nojiriensis]|uniref:tetratricopeptide repeat protein n=1 Tax=Streptomyces nojiriensis TaxID=66374 RepID=UPI0036DAD8E1
MAWARRRSPPPWPTSPAPKACACSGCAGADRPNCPSRWPASPWSADSPSLHQQNLTDRERTLGPDHPQTLSSRNNLALALQALGRHQEAASLHQQVLSDLGRIFGPDHPQTLSSRNNLANALQALGRHQQAADLHQQNLTDRERTLGPDHPQTLNSRNNLARLGTQAPSGRASWWRWNSLRRLRRG